MTDCIRNEEIADYIRGFITGRYGSTITTGDVASALSADPADHLDPVLVGFIRDADRAKPHPLFAHSCPVCGMCAVCGDETDDMTLHNEIAH